VVDFINGAPTLTPLSASDEWSVLAASVLAARGFWEITSLELTGYAGAGWLELLVAAPVSTVPVVAAPIAAAKVVSYEAEVGFVDEFVAGVFDDSA
jgi:hypothetical protein